ncbi:hypothetical protein CJO94_00320 [Ralstonia solanacearum]|nr:hypothetical protein CJO94_00320 [Ralstonia solanacearum]
MAAVLTGESLSQEATLSNRLWGGLNVVGGVLEMVGASALCVMPEPTMASKVGCVVFGVHGSDTAAAGAKQVWTGQDTRTLIQQGTAKLAQTLNVDANVADSIGLSLDIAVPFGLSGMIGAVRASSIRMGRLNLKWHEAKNYKTGPGGHTLLKHVGKTEVELLARLAAEPRRNLVSSFTNQRTAEWAISEVLRAHVVRIAGWARSNPSHTLSLTKNVGQTVGIVLVRGAQAVVPGRTVIVVLKCEKHNGMPYYVLTAYLEH